MAKQSSSKLSSIASRVLSDGKPYWMPDDYWLHTMKPLAASVLSQDETPGQVAASEIDADRANFLATIDDLDPKG